MIKAMQTTMERPNPKLKILGTCAREKSAQVPGQFTLSLTGYRKRVILQAGEVALVHSAAEPGPVPAGVPAEAPVEQVSLPSAQAAPSS